VWQRHNQLVVPHELVLRNLADFGQISAKDAAGFQGVVPQRALTAARGARAGGAETPLLVLFRRLL